MTKITKKWHTPGEDAFGRPLHYYASSLAEWRVNTDLLALVEQMKKGGMTFTVFMVHLPISAKYSIKDYAPALPAEQCQRIAVCYAPE